MAAAPILAPSPKVEDIFGDDFFANFDEEFGEFEGLEEDELFNDLEGFENEFAGLL